MTQDAARQKPTIVVARLRISTCARPGCSRPAAYVANWAGRWAGGCTKLLCVDHGKRWAKEKELQLPALPDEEAVPIRKTGRLAGDLARERKAKARK